MIIGVPKEILKNEKRVAVIPSTVKEYIKKGIEVIIETNAGAGSFISDNEYESAGAKIIDDVKELFSKSDLILKVFHFFRQQWKKKQLKNSLIKK